MATKEEHIKMQNYWFDQIRDLENQMKPWLEAIREREKKIQVLEEEINKYEKKMEPLYNQIRAHENIKYDLDRKMIYSENQYNLIWNQNLKKILQKQYDDKHNTVRLC
jgi:septal ring factor EnvC (AmiA/AmiB activator)